MKDYRCDICGKQEATLSSLREKYQVDGMVDLCGECSSELDKAHTKITKVSNELRDSWVVNFIRALKSKKYSSAQTQGVAP